MEKINLAASDEMPFKDVLKYAEKAFQELYDNGGYKPEDINNPTNRKLIEATQKVFDFAIKDNEIPPEMLFKLQNDTFIFSGLKTHAQLMEAASLLRDESGKIRSFDSFAHEFNKINQDYNQNYLEAEYQFAVSSSQQAANWAALDDSDRYYLQYRTAFDDRVRESHAILHDTTLPKDDDFWRSYYPPNGWRCRCTAVEVRRTRYEMSDSEKAIANGERATSQIGKDGKNKSEIFRFNPGAEQKVFPPKHPYNKVKGAEEVKEIVRPPIIPDGLLEIEKKFNFEVPRELLSHLRDNNFKVTNNNRENVYYTNYGAKKINFTDSYLNGRSGEYRKKSVVVHEFGHAIDYQRGLAERPEVKALMDKYREKYSENRNKIFRYLSDVTKATTKKAMKDRKQDWCAQSEEMADILKSLNTKYGSGHSTEYFQVPLKPEREFLAHCFELKYGAGNTYIKRMDKQLHDDMVNLLDIILK